MKDEEIKALRDRMIKMESIIPVQDDCMNGDDDSSPQREEGEAEDGGKVPEVRVKRLMDEDPAFRRGRLRWLKQEQQRILNLQTQNITKKLRGQNQIQGQSSPVVPVHLPGTGRFIPPQECKLKFPFKSNPAHRLSWGPASAALQALGLMDGGEGEEQREDGEGGDGGVEAKGSPSPPPQGPSPALLPLPFPAPPPRMRTPSPNRVWQQRNQGNQGGFFYHPQGNNQNQQRRYRRNSLDSSSHSSSNHNNDQHHGGGGHQGRPRQRRGASPGPGGERGGGRAGGGGGGRDRDGGFHYNHQQPHQYHHHPYYNPHNAPFQPGPYPNYHSLPRSGAPPLPPDMLLGAGPPQGGWGFTTPPRMRRQFSAPDLKNNKETPI
ncbi:kinesin-like protein KIF1C [Notolabrus celidotus]|uniref:kinesin-like protein KIF1C n=1 Tax=Notolabrus celidotus TaxID=1203425 RepID=UPI00148F9475|nr:kinesin-like protein KIF1C [Notolabrus celidotus]